MLIQTNNDENVGNKSILYNTIHKSEDTVFTN